MGHVDTTNMAPRLWFTGSEDGNIAVVVWRHESSRPALVPASHREKMKGFQWSSCLGFAKDDTLHLLVESNLLTPTTARVYVNLTYGKCLTSQVRRGESTGDSGEDEQFSNSQDWIQLLHRADECGVLSRQAPACKGPPRTACHSCVVTWDLPEHWGLCEVWATWRWLECLDSIIWSLKPLSGISSQKSPGFRLKHQL